MNVQPRVAPRAFELVRQLLTERPRSFQELIKDGIALHSNVDGDVAEASGSVVAARNVRKGKGKVVAAAQSIMPPDHPFVSNSFLKNRILPILASQDLILKSAVHPISSGDSAKRTTARSTFVWSLKSPYTPPSTSANPLPIPDWDPESHWTSLLSGAHPSELGHEYNTVKLLRAEVEKEMRKVDGKEDRSEREIWEWDCRQEGITTNLERIHLNTRRRNARPTKERKMLEYPAKMAEGMARAEERRARSLKEAEERARAIQDIARRELEKEGKLVA